MTETLSQSQPTLNLESTQQALNQLRSLRQKRKKQNPSSIYDMVKSIYSHMKEPVMSKVAPLQTISAKEYLGNSRDSIEQMLVFIKNKICGDVDFQVNCNNFEQTNQSNQCKIKLNYEFNVTTGQETSSLVKQKQAQIGNLMEQIKNLEWANKNMQIKLLNNVKRLTLQVQQKQIQLKQIRKILQEKEQQIQDMYILNEKKHKKMRKLQEDIYDLRLELAEKNDELEAERDCADFLEKKVDKLMSFPTQNQFSNSERQLKTGQQNTQTSQVLTSSEL